MTTPSAAELEARLRARAAEQRANNSYLLDAALDEAVADHLASEPARIQEAVERECEQCALTVELLSTDPPYEAATFKAIAAKNLRLRWRSRPTPASPTEGEKTCPADGGK